MSKPVVINFIGNAKNLHKTIDETKGRFGGLKKHISSVFLGLGIGTAVIGGLKSTMDAAKETLAVSRETTTRIKEMGAESWISAGHVNDLATAISNKTGKDDEAIQSGANMLLTFGKIRNEVGKGNDIFDQATQVATDMAAKFGGDASNNAIRLGKALNDPIKGMTALGRIGVQFDPIQQKTIRNFVKQGDILGAQKVILAEVGKQTRGAAEASTTGWDKFQVKMGNIQESLGLKLIPILDRTAAILSRLTDFVVKHSLAVGAAIAAILALTAYIKIYTLVTTESAAKTAIITAATKAWSAAQWLLNHAMKANPILLIVSLVVMLTVAVIAAYKHNEKFRQVVDTVWRSIRNAVATGVNFIIGLLKGWLDMQFSVVAGILHVMGKLPGPMGAPFRKAEEAVRKAKATVDDQITKIQNKVNSLRGRDIPIKASLGLNFSPSFTQKDWVNVRVQAGRMAGGGMLDGPGTGTSDSIPLWGSKGEFMVNAESTKRWLPVLQWINAKGFARGGGIDFAGTQAGYNAVSKVQVKGTSKIMSKGLQGLMEHFGALAGAGAGGAGGGSLANWIMQAIAITRVPISWAAALRRRALFESGGNPRAINLWDSNAKAGIPSMGLMQTIMPTFLAYAWDGLRNIWNPVHNLVAAIRYILSRYGSIFRIDPPVSGYKDGTPYVPRDQLAFLHQGEAVLTAAQNRRRGQGPITLTVHVNVSGVIATDKRKLANALAEDVRSAIRSAQQRSGLPAIA